MSYRHSEQGGDDRQKETWWNCVLGQDQNDSAHLHSVARNLETGTSTDHQCLESRCVYVDVFDYTLICLIRIQGVCC